MAELTYRDAVARGIAQEMARDEDVVFLGEDVAKAGGVFKATVGLYDQFGPLRVRDTPISEQAILGAAMGAAMTGLKPIAEIMFSDFIAVCFDYIANEFPKSRYMTNGQVKVPLVIRTANGGSAHGGIATGNGANGGAAGTGGNGGTGGIGGAGLLATGSSFTLINTGAILHGLPGDANGGAAFGGSSSSGSAGSKDRPDSVHAPVQIVVDEDVVVFGPVVHLDARVA